MIERFVVHDDHEWLTYPTLSRALQAALEAAARGDSDVTMYEQIDWHTLIPAPIELPRSDEG